METFWTILALAFGVFSMAGIFTLVVGLLAVPFVLAALLWRGSGRRRPA